MSRSAKPSERPRRSWSRRLLRAGLWTLGLLLLLPLLLLGFLETGLGKRTFAGLVESLASSPGAELSIEGLEGSLWDELRVARVTLADDQGAWLVAEELRLDWSPSRLFSGEVAVAELALARLQLSRLPPVAAEEAPAEPGPLLPSLPLAIAVERLAIEQIELGQPVLGSEARLALVAKAFLGAGGADAEIDLARTDGIAGFLRGTLAWEPATDLLTVDLAAHEPQGGLVTRVLELPDLPALDLAFKGQGILADWQGTLALRLDGQETLQAEVAVTGEPRRRITLVGDLPPPAMTLLESVTGEPALTRLAVEGLAIDAAVLLEEQQLVVEHLGLSSTSFALTASGGLDLADELLDLDLNLELSEGAALAPLVPELSLRSAQVTGKLVGAFGAPEAILSATLEQPATADVAFDRARLAITATPQTRESGGYALSLVADLAPPRFADPSVPWIWGAPRLTGTLAYDAAADRFALSALTLAGDELDLQLAGDLDLVALAGRATLSLRGLLPPLPELGPAPLHVALEGEIAGDDLASALQSQLDATFTGTEALPDELGALLGPQVTLAGGFDYAEDGLTLRDVTIATQQLALGLEGSYAEGGLAVDWTLRAADLAAALAPFEVPATGSLDLAGTLRGDPESSLAVDAELNARDLAVAGSAIGTLTGRLGLAGLPDSPLGRLDLQAPASPYGPLALAAEVTPLAGGAFRLAPLRVALGDALDLAGELEAPAAGLPLAGRLAGQVTGNALLERLLGVTLQGSGNLVLDLSAPEGRQDAVVLLELGPGILADTAHDGLTLGATLEDLLGRPAIDARLAIRPLALPGQPAVEVTLKGAGDPADWMGELALALDGEAALQAQVGVTSGQQTSLSLDGRLEPAGLAMLEQLAGDPTLRQLAPDGLDLLAKLDLAGDRLAVKSLALRDARLALTLTGSADLAAETLQADLALEIAEGAALAPLLPDLAFAAGRLEGTLAGSFAAPSLTLTAALQQPAASGLALESLRLRVQATPLGPAALEQEGYDLALQAELAPPTLTRPLPVAWIWGAAALTGRGRYDPAAASFTLNEVALRGDELDLRATGHLDLPAMAGELTVKLAALLPPLPELGPAPLRLALDAELASGEGAGPLQGQLVATLTGTEALPEGLGALLGPEVKLAGGLGYAADGSVTLEAVSLVADRLALDLDGRYAPSDLALAWRLEVGDLAALAPFGVTAAGALEAKGELKGDPATRLDVTADLAAQELVYEGTRIGALTGSVRLDNWPEAASGHVTLKAPATAYGPLDLVADVTPHAGGGFRIEPLRLALGGALDLEGRLEGGATGLPLVGRLTGRVTGNPLLASLGLPLQGSGRMTLELTSPGGRQDAVVTLELAPGALAGVVHGGMTLRATARDLLGRPALDARLDARGVELAGGRFDSLQATAQGALADLAITLDLKGDLSGPTELSLAGRLQSAGLVLSLQRLAGQVAGLPVTLQAPTRLALDQLRVIEPLSLEVAGGLVTLQGRQGGALDLQIQDLPLQPFAVFLDKLEPRGTVNLTLSLTGGGRPSGTLRLEATGLAVREDGLSLGPAVDLTVDGTLGGGRLDLLARLDGDFGEDLEVTLGLPFQLSLVDYSVSVPSRGALEGRANWQGDVGTLVDFLPLDDQLLRGPVSLDATLGGTVGDPTVAGSLRLDGGRYENLVTGTVLADLTLVVSGEGRQIVVEEARANDGKGGRLTLTGDLDLEQGLGGGARMALTLEKFRVLGRDDLWAVVDGTLDLDDQNGRPTLIGRLTAEEVHVDISARLPPEVVTLDVTLVRDGVPVNPPKEGEGKELEEATVPFALDLDITLDLPRRVFVRGDGLDSEWGGSLTVDGTTARPIVRGSLAPERGQFELLGKAFLLDGGAITFDGGPAIDPILSLRAVNKVRDLTAVVEVSGRASKPEITITSQPELPQDEVLSRVLFSRGTGQLSPVEAAQLAETLAILSGATGSDRTLTERLRDTIGLDVFRVGGGDDENMATATVGQYVAEGVFVGVTQGTTPNSTAATLEVELTPNIVLDAEAGTVNSVGVHWQWDY